MPFVLGMPSKVANARCEAEMTAASELDRNSGRSALRGLLIRNLIKRIGIVRTVIAKSWTYDNGYA